MENNEKNKPNIFEVLGSKNTFIFGIVAGIMTLSTIGFFFLLLSGSVDFNTIGNSTDSKTTFGTTNTNTTVTNTNTTAPTAQINMVPVTSDDHVRGDLETADVVVVEFSDLECPFCARFHPTMQQVYSDYDGQVAWVYRQFPLESLHPKARNEAIASECAADLGGNEAFWSYIDRIYEITPSNNGLDESKLAETAEYVGLDATEFQNCMDSGKFEDKIDSQLTDAAASGGTGTPYSVAINKDGEMAPINGAQPITSVKATIDSLL